MNVNNLERATKIKEELARLNEAIDALENSSDVRGFVVAEHKDCSGWYLDYQFKEGNFHPMYEDIKSFVHTKFIEAREQLLAEIDSL